MPGRGRKGLAARYEQEVFRNRLMVMGEWVWAYYTRERSAQLITGDTEAPTWNPQRIEATGATTASA
jgi:hypothetical protein